MYHMHTLGASKYMHVVHSDGFAMGVGFGWFYLILSLLDVGGARTIIKHNWSTWSWTPYFTHR